MGPHFATAAETCANTGVTILECSFAHIIDLSCLLLIGFVLFGALVSTSKR